MDLTGLPPPLTFSFGAAGGLRLCLDAYLPPQVRPPYPALLFLHGGGLIWGSRTMFVPQQARAYLDAGLAFITADYRLAPETKLDGILADARAGLDWLRTTGERELGLDPGRIGVAGASAGGYLALYLGTLPGPPQAIVSYYGFGDLLAGWCTTPSPHHLGQALVSEAEAWGAVGSRPLVRGGFSRSAFYAHARQRGHWTWAVSGLDPGQPGDRQALARVSPVRAAGPGYPPTLLIHGEQDQDVPPDQAQPMAASLAASGVAHQLHLVPGAGHGFDWEVRSPQAGRALQEAVELVRRLV